MNGIDGEKIITPSKERLAFAGSRPAEDDHKVRSGAVRVKPVWVRSPHRVSTLQLIYEAVVLCGELGWYHEKSTLVPWDECAYIFIMHILKCT